MKIKENKPISRSNKIIWTVLYSLALLACCYCGIFVFPWGTHEFIMAFGVAFLGALIFNWLPAPEIKYKGGIMILVLAIVAVPGIFGILKLRAYYAESQLEKHGITTTGEVVKLFKESRGKYGSNKVNMAKIAYRAGNAVVYNDIDNKKKYLNVGDRMKLVYSSKNPDIFEILGHYKAEEPKVDNRVPADITFIDTRPMFPGDMPALYAYLRDNLVYPQEAKDQRISGKVFVSFVITEDGSVDDVKVEKGIGGGCDEAAINAVSNMPKWRPGVQKGKPVRVKYNIPISFSL